MIPGRGHLAIVLLQEDGARLYAEARDTMDDYRLFRGVPVGFMFRDIASLWQRLAADASKRARVLAGIEEDKSNP